MALSPICGIGTQTTRAYTRQMQETMTLGRHIPTLDGWRAVAVLLVIGGHSSRMLRESDSQIGNLAARFFAHGGFGVDVFFAISGFLIVTLLLREKMAQPIDLPGFYKRRAFRILPPIVAYMGVIIAMAFAGLIPLEPREVAAVFGFYRNYISGNWYTGHFWSLAIEEHFYLVVPLVIALCKIKRAIAIAGMAAIACIVIRTVEWSLFPDWKVEFRTESRFDALMFGSLFAMLAHAQSSRSWMTKRLTGWVALGTLAMAIVLLVAIPVMPVRRTVVAIALPVILGYSILRPRELLGRFLELPWLRYVGRISYSLYIWQMLFFMPYAPDMPRVQSFPIALIGTVLCALASYYFVERPAMRWARSKPRGALTTTQAAG